MVPAGIGYWSLCIQSQSVPKEDSVWASLGIHRSIFGIFEESTTWLSRPKRIVIFCSVAGSWWCEKKTNMFLYYHSFVLLGILPIMAYMGRFQPIKKGYLFQVSEHDRVRYFSSWHLWKGRNSVILVCQRAQKEQTDALYGCDRQVWSTLTEV